MPALLMRTSRVPTSSTPRWICARSVTSSVRGVTRGSVFCSAPLRVPAYTLFAPRRGLHRRIDERLADAAIGSGDQNCLICDVHNYSPFDHCSFYLLSIGYYGWPGAEDTSHNKDSCFRPFRLPEGARWRSRPCGTVLP